MRTIYRPQTPTSTPTPPKPHPSHPQQLPEFVERSVKQAVSCARAPDHATKPGPEYASFVADTLSTHPARTAIISYSLPSTWGGVPPVLARVSVAVVPLRVSAEEEEAQRRREAAAAAKAARSKKKKGSSKGGVTEAEQSAAAAGDQGAAVGGEGAAVGEEGADAAKGVRRGPPVAVLVTVQYAVPQELQIKTRGEWVWLGVCTRVWAGLWLPSFVEFKAASNGVHLRSAFSHQSWQF